MSAAIPFLDAAALTRATPMPLLVKKLGQVFSGNAHAAPARLSADIGDNASLLVMPAWNRAGQIGVKIVDIDQARQPSVRAAYMVMDRASGQPLAMLDGATLTRRRTAAASVLAATHLARPKSRSLLLIGTGALIAPLIEAYTSFFAIDRIEIWGRDPAKAEAAAGAARALGHPAVATTRLASAIAGNDIVCAATLSTQPIIHGEDLSGGTHLDLIGAFRPDMCEADGPAFARARVFVDTREGALHEAGDLIQAIAGGDISQADILGDLADLCSGRIAGRDGDDQTITLFKSVGTAIEDLAAAELALGLG